jgi:hypothetical protein
MLHRVQTYYLAVVIIIQAITTTGIDFFRFFDTDETVYVFNAWGLSAYASGDRTGGTLFPVFVGFIALALLAFLCMMSYKNIDRQFKLGRLVFYLYFVSVISVYLFATFGEDWVSNTIESREVGWGYWLFIAGFPFSFLANTGIKRDKRILDSLKRL